MIATLDYPRKKSGRLLASQIETVQEDLVRLSGVFMQLMDLPMDILRDLDLSGEVDSLHRSLIRFENHCATLSVISKVEQDLEAVADIGPYTSFRTSDQQWGAVRRNAKRANQLAGQLTLTLMRLRDQENEISGQSDAPEDIQRMNLSVVSSVNRLLAEWNQPLE